MIWKERKWLVAGIAVLLLINGIFFVTYRVRYQSRIESLDGSLDEARQELATAIAERRKAAEIIGTVDNTRKDLDQVYNDWWSTRPERLAPMIVELQTLAQKSGLTPPGRSYSWNETVDREDIGAQALTVSFQVKGTYDQIRNLINLIELSPHFVIIEEIGFNDASDGGDSLALTLRLKTLFRTEAEQELPSA